MHGCAVYIIGSMINGICNIHTLLSESVVADRRGFSYRKHKVNSFVIMCSTAIVCVFIHVIHSLSIITYERTMQAYYIISSIIGATRVVPMLPG